MTNAPAAIIREYGPFPDIPRANGVTYDGAHIWIAAGETLNAVDPESGEVVRSLAAAAHAGTAFDGRHLYQVAGEVIQKIDPATGAVVARVPTPAGGAAGMAWAEGRLWVGQHSQRRIHELDPETGAILRTLVSNRFVTGVTWAGDELWHATWENDESELRRIDADTGEVLQALPMPPGVSVSGLESDGGELLFCGGGNSGKVRVVRKPVSAPKARPG
jgi:glutamine cyclotransferase